MTTYAFVKKDNNTIKFYIVKKNNKYYTLRIG